LVVIDPAVPLNATLLLPVDARRVQDDSENDGTGYGAKQSEGDGLHTEG